VAGGLKIHGNRLPSAAAESPYANDRIGVLSTAAFGMSCSVMPVEIRSDDDRVFALHRVVAFDAFFGVVAGLAFLDDELDAADAAVALVEHIQIINAMPVGDRNARPGKRAGAIGKERNVNSVLRLRRRVTAVPRPSRPPGREQDASDAWPVFSLETQRAGSQPARLYGPRPLRSEASRPAAGAGAGIGAECAPSVRKGPHPQLLFTDLPEPRQAGWVPRPETR
jgi:hypothetical protein